MTSERHFDRSSASGLRHDAGAVTDDGIAVRYNSAKAAKLQSFTANVAVPKTPVQSLFKAGVMMPRTTSDILNMKTPEFRPYVPSSKTKELTDNEISGTDVKKNLYSCLVPDKGCASHSAVEGSSGGITNNSSSLRKEYGPPLLRRLREDPSLKNVRFDFGSSSSSEDDDDYEQDAENVRDVVKKNDRRSPISEGFHLPGSSVESDSSSKGSTKQSTEKKSIYNSCKVTTGNKLPTGIPNKPSLDRAGHFGKELLDHKQSDNALQPHNSGEDNSTIRVNGKYYYIFSIIGSGGSSKVYDVYDDKKHTYAVKFVSLEDADEQVTAMFLNEVTILKQLKNCERVVKLYDYEYCKKKKMLSLVMEKGDTDLSGVLRSIMHANSLSPITIKFYWSEMLHAVKEIHEKGIIHSDLKPANFLLVKGKLKLIDFGIADTMQADVTSVIKSSQMGTLNFMSPESIMGTGEISQKTGKPDIKINTKSDVWSLGCILYALVYGRPPFQDMTSAPQKLHAITNSKHPIPFPETEDHHLLDVLQQCLQRNPKQRPTIAELLQHPYLVEGKSRAASTRPELASVISSIENLSPRSIQMVESFVKAIQKK